MHADTAAQNQACLPRWLWLWFPPLLLVVIIPVRLASSAAYRHWVDGELGLIEIATPLVALAGVVFGILAYRSRARLPSRRLRLWVLLLTLSCGYLAGEEVSWGQHLFGWRTPSSIAAVNDQQETNLHNVSSWFDQKPRLFLEIWVLVGGIVVPSRILCGYRCVGEAAWFWPGVVCLPTAILAIGVRLPQRVKSLLALPSLPMEIRFSEPQEYYFALFLALYLASIYCRLRD